MLDVHVLYKEMGLLHALYLLHLVCLSEHRSDLQILWWHQFERCALRVQIGNPNQEHSNTTIIEKHLVAFHLPHIVHLYMYINRSG